MVEATNRLSLIGRPLNPRVQNLNAVIAALPRVWGLTTRVHGRILDAPMFNFYSKMKLICSLCIEENLGFSIIGLLLQLGGRLLQL